MRRRDLIQLAVLAPVLGACGSEGPSFSCEGDTARLTDAERAMRTTQQYTDQSPEPDRDCAGCRYYTPAPAGHCGACQLVRGSIHPDGYCNLWTGRA